MPSPATTKRLVKCDNPDCPEWRGCKHSQPHIQSRACPCVYDRWALCIRLQEGKR